MLFHDRAGPPAVGAHLIERAIQTSPNNLPALRPLFLVILIFIACFLGGLGFGALQRAPHPNRLRPGWAQPTSQAGTVSCNTKRAQNSDF